MSWLFFYLVCLFLYTDIFWKWLWLNQSTITVIHLGMGNQANGMASLWYCDSLHICTLLVLQFRRIPEATNSKCLDRRWLWRRLVTVYIASHYWWHVTLLNWLAIPAELKEALLQAKTLGITNTLWLLYRVERCYKMPFWVHYHISGIVLKILVHVDNGHTSFH